ncbi:MAG: recombinase family protein [Defluviitaleaceae bacterium]|nr:recombinase family protein [Defluviitaleaceae bacterium]
MPENKSIAVYSRKSKFTGKGESIDNQIELCKRYIHTHYNGNTEDILVYEDEGFSGGNTERPKFKKMMAEARGKKISAIICYRLDRISRNIGDFAKLIEELDGLGVSFVSIKERFDTSSPMGRAMMYISSVFSQLERETIAERIRDNMFELSKTGRWLGGITPTGYVSVGVENVSVNGKTKRACKLELIPEEAEMVKFIFANFLRVNSMSKTETLLIKNGYKTKNGKIFTRFAIKNILTNPVYMTADEAAYDYLRERGVDLFAYKADFDGKRGIMVYNRSLQKPGKTTVIRPPNEWVAAVGKHEALVSGADWVKAQEQLGQNSAKSYRKPRSNVALLSGILFCVCGDYMRPKLSKRVNKSGDRTYTYFCAMKEKSRMHSCQVNNINGNMLDAAIGEEITRLDADASEFVKQLEIGKKLPESNRDEYDENLEHLRAELAEYEKKIAGLVSALAKSTGTASEVYIMKQIEKYHLKIESYKSRIAVLEGLASTHAFTDIEFDSLRHILAHFRATFGHMEIEQKRAALRSLIKRIVWDGVSIHVHLLGEDSK